jgi:hypothetical protein
VTEDEQRHVDEWHERRRLVRDERWEQEARQFEARKALADEMHATRVDPYVRRFRAEHE